MLQLDIKNLLFSKSFLDLKYKTKSKEAIKKIKEKYSSGKLDFFKVGELVDLEKINNFVSKNKDNYEDIVVLGIGGSALGTKAIMQAIKGKYYNELSFKKRNNFPKLYILDNIDPEEIKSILDVIKLNRTLFIVISKSGSTIETLSLYNFFKKKIKNNGLDYRKHFVIIAGEDSSFKKNSKKQGLITFDIPNSIGGRFSVLTSVGLLPLAFIGIDIQKLLDGVKNYKDKFLNEDSSENISLLTAIINYHCHIELGKNILVLFPYSSNLYYFGEWYKQLLAESLGKGGLGLTPNIAIGVTDQHSQLQLYYDGPNDKVLNFLEVKNSKIDYDITKNFSFKQLLDIEKYATAKSITDYNKINYTLVLDELKEETIGELIIMYEAQIAIMAELFGVNAFDQPGVEIGKKIAKQKIKENIGILDFLEKNNSRNITFIGGGNGQSSILSLFKEYNSKIIKTNNINYNISSIVAMSDDGRTTGLLMDIFKKELGVHLPPPGDLRRILFTLSKSSYKDFFSITFNKIFSLDKEIGNYTIWDLFRIISNELIKESRVLDLKKDILDFLDNKGNIYKLLKKVEDDVLNFKLPLKASLKGHKFGNILMASLYYNFGYDYSKMLNFMHKLLEVDGEVLPITTDEARIKAILKNGEVIKTQDKISNVANYNSTIEKIEFLNGLNPRITSKIKEKIKNSDYIIITPGDLYTSILANFIVDGLIEEIDKSDAKIIYILNANNKVGETTGYKIIDFVDIINKNLGNKKIDYLLGNKIIPALTQKQKEKFIKNISVKGGEYLILKDFCINKIIQKYKKIKIISGEYINSKDLYKYNESLIKDLVSILK